MAGASRWGRRRGRSARALPLHTVTLRATADGLTELTLVHERLETLQAERRDVAEHVERGWEMALDKLVALAREAI